MHLSRLLPAALSLSVAHAAIGFTTYKDILENRDNSGEVAYSSLGDRSNTLFLYIQIVAGQDHSSIIQDFKTLCNNYGSKGVAVIPRVRYGSTDGSIAAEPTDQDQILQDVSQWAKVFSDVAGTIDMPVIQAGFLGQWGEWHDGPFCETRGEGDSQTNIDLKRQIITTLQGTGQKIALRYPQDHKQLFDGDRSVTIHDDCIFDEGPGGTDGWTFPPLPDTQTWVDYAKKVASNNTFGGEGCGISANEGGYDWTDKDGLCGADGIAEYLDSLGMAYMNTGNPGQFQDLIDDSGRSECVDHIQSVLESYN